MGAPSLRKISGYPLNEGDILELQEKQKANIPLAGAEAMDMRIAERSTDLRDQVYNVERFFDGVDENGEAVLGKRITQKRKERVIKKFSPSFRASLFGGEEGELIEKEDERLRPAQQEFIDLYNQSEGNLCLGSRTGDGKTLTCMKLALEELMKDPFKYVVITTPARFLIKQMKKGCIEKFESLHPLLDKTWRGKPQDLQKNEREFDELLGSAQGMNDDSFLACIETEYPHLMQRLIIETPQKVQMMFKNGHLNPNDVSLMVFDEGAIGSATQTKEYSTFGIYNYLKKSPHTRLIVADGTPMETDFLKKSFDIEHFYFGEDPRFVSPIDSQVVNIPADDSEYERLGNSLRAILRERYHNLFNFVSEHQRIFPNIHNSLPSLQAHEIPYLRRADYQSLLKRVFEIKGRTNSNFEQNVCSKCSSYLAAYNQIQELYGRLQTETYQSTSQRIDFFKSKIEEDPYDSTLSKVMGDDLLLFGEEIEKALEQGALHPKIIELKKLLLKMVNEGKKVLVICNRISSLDVINQMCEKWGIKAGTIQGETTKTNLMRQQFVINQMNKGEIDVLISSSVAKRGLDLPDLDTVISYSPQDNGSDDIQARGRLRQGGEMLTLCINGGERIKARKNQGEQMAFFRKRAAFLEEEKERGLATEHENLLLSKFKGPKDKFFVKDLLEFNAETMTSVFSERFFLMNVEAPEVNKRFGTVSLRLSLKDKTGVISYYYNFGNNLELANEFFAEYSAKQIPVIVNGRIKKSKAGNIYLTGKHTEGYFQEGIIPCPIEDADLDALGVDEGDIQERTANEVTMVIVPIMAPKRIGHKKGVDPEQGELNLF
jgi:ERCC4-related helicase